MTAITTPLAPEVLLRRKRDRLLLHAGMGLHPDGLRKPSVFMAGLGLGALGKVTFISQGVEVSEPTDIPDLWPDEINTPEGTKPPMYWACTVCRYVGARIECPNSFEKGKAHPVVVANSYQVWRNDARAVRAE